MNNSVERIKVGLSGVGRFRKGEITLSGITLISGDVDLDGIRDTLVKELAAGMSESVVHVSPLSVDRAWTLFGVRSNDICVMDHPEIRKISECEWTYDHPRKQMETVGHVVDLFNKGVRVLLPSNSDYILFGLRIAVKEGRLASDDVSLVHFVDDGKEIDYVQPRILPDGMVDIWPEGFFDWTTKALVKLM